MAGLMLTGCGDAAYDLTDKEESIIVNYAAHMVTKYNTYQKEGLAYVDLVTRIRRILTVKLPR